MKRIKLRFLLLLRLAISAISATSYDFKVDGIYDNINGTRTTAKLLQ